MDWDSPRHFHGTSVHTASLMSTDTCVAAAVSLEYCRQCCWSVWARRAHGAARAAPPPCSLEHSISSMRGEREKTGRPPITFPLGLGHIAGATQRVTTLLQETRAQRFVLEEKRLIEQTRRANGIEQHAAWSSLLGAHETSRLSPRGDKDDDDDDDEDQPQLSCFLWTATSRCPLHHVWGDAFLFFESNTNRHVHCSRHCCGYICAAGGPGAWTQHQTSG